MAEDTRDPEHEGVDAPEAYQELRLALAMSGGVSLAIWMGGVATEVYRIVRADPLADPPEATDDVAAEVYGGLLRLTRSTPRVDIIAGASAGGLNGAFLAMAMVHRSDLGILQSLWLEKASLSKLFRSPLEVDPPSLLRGDEFFLPELRSAFQALQRGSARPPDDVPIRLIMTTTMLNGDARAFADDLGSLLPDVMHAAQFRFRRGAGIETDDFDRPDILDRLALAARSTASFPGAFEASFIPVGEHTRRPNRPDMRENVDFDTSRYVMDGGVLVNKPIAPALRAIFAQPAGAQSVRRVFAYVVPDPGVAGADEPDSVSEIPSMGRVVLRSLITVPRAQSVGGDLEGLAEHNRRARGQQLLRDRLLRPPEQGADLARLASELFDSYRKLRAANVVDGALALQDPVAAHRAGLSDEAVRILRWMVGEGGTPWVPTGKTRDEAAGAGGWPWGADALESAGIVALDVVRRAINLCRTRYPELAGYRETLGQRRAEIHDDLARVRALRRLEQEQYLPDELRSLMAGMAEREGDPAAPDLQAWMVGWMDGRERFEDWLRARTTPAPDPERVARDLASRLIAARSTILEAADTASGAVTRESERAEWSAVRRRVETVVQGSEEDTLRVLVDLAIVQLTFTAGMPVLEQAVDFIQISGNTPNGLDDRATVDRKVAGIQMGHFGSFYKSSWRANDWMWGRLDAAMRLTQVLLSPARLREGALDRNLEGEKAVDWAVQEIEALAVPDGGAGDVLGTPWKGEREAVRRELAYLADSEGPVPGSLPVGAGAVARRLQLDILCTELPQVAGAIEADRRGGAAVGGSARRFADAVKAAAGDGGRLPPADATRLFPQCRVGEERIADEAGSDLYTTTAAQAMAVGVSAGSGARGGLGPLRGVLRSVRNLFLAVYLLARSAVRGRSGFALVTALLAIGGAIVAVGLTREEMGGGFPSTWFDWLGVILVGAGVLLTAIRAGLIVTAVYVVVAAAVAWWPYAFVRDHYADAGGFRGWLYDVRLAIPIVVLVIASVGLGFVKRSPWWRTLAVVLGLGAVAAVAYFAVRDFREPELWLVIAAPATAAVLGFALAWWMRGDRDKRRTRVG